MILILDNVSYHLIKGELHIVPSQMSRMEAATFLIDVGDTIFTQAQLSARRGTANLPDKKDLQRRVAAVLKQKPDAQPGRTKVLELLNQNGHDAVYTPPFTPDFQPIELLWADIKHN